MLWFGSLGYAHFILSELQAIINLRLFWTPILVSATNRLVTSKDHASVQLNIGHLDADGIYTGQFTTLALCGFVRAQGDADSGVDRLWQKKEVETKQH
ncbi:unnamed protein product [Brassica rapa]|uniref:40S ribosomal protein S21 n=1 Tax=Brassica campestris TaxID=3711 RepID=A0A3P5Z5Z8_BRACM|nr:unnamed protein product [Brassica rapa]VDC68500.1 unnamed protein product [Brassica rapa]